MRGGSQGEGVRGLQPAVRDRRSGAGMRLARILGLVVLLMTASICRVAAEARGAAGSTIKVGDEVVLMSDDRPDRKSVV